MVSPPSPAECVAKLLDFCQSDRWEVVSQTSFHLHFFHLSVLTILPMVQGHLHFFSWDLSGNMFSPFFWEVVGFSFLLFEVCYKWRR